MEGGTTAPDVLYNGVEYAAMAIETLAIVLIVTYIFSATGSYLYARFGQRDKDPGKFEDYRAHLARALLLGLEILVAADVVRTVALDATLEEVAGLGLLVLVRTFLGWSVAVELDGCWPWQVKDRAARAGERVGLRATRDTRFSEPAAGPAS